MLEAYSLNVTVASDTAIPFNNTTIKKGCTVSHDSPSSFELNKCGVYMVAVDASLEASGTIQLYKDGVAQSQAQATGGTPSFVTLVQVAENNTCCPCTSPTTIQVVNAGTADITCTNANISITKVV